MAALQVTLAKVFENIYTEKSKTYLNSKNFDVTTIVKDQRTEEFEVKFKSPTTNRFLTAWEKVSQVTRRFPTFFSIFPLFSHPATYYQFAINSH